MGQTLAKTRELMDDKAPKLHVVWADYRNSCYDLSYCVPLRGDVKAAMSAVLAAPDRFFGFCTYEDQPDYRWLAPRGTTRFPMQSGWRALACKFVPPAIDEEKTFSDGFTGDDALPDRPEDMVWARPGRGEGFEDEGKHLLDVMEGAEPGDLRQGNNRDCWFICAMAVLAEFPEGLAKLMDPCRLSMTAKYTLHLQDFSKHKPASVVVDDRLPLLTKKVIEVACTDITGAHEIWPCIVEKGMAKLAGGYKKLYSMNADTMFALGMCCQCEKLLAFEKMTDGWVMHKAEPSSSCPDHYRGAVEKTHWPDDRTPGSSPREGVDVLRLLAEFQERGFPIFCTIDRLNGGLFQGAALAILLTQEMPVPQHDANSGVASARVVDPARTAMGPKDYTQANKKADDSFMVLLRSPWMNHNWRGDWGRTSDLWGKHPDIAELLSWSRHLEYADWMHEADFLMKFSAIGVVCKDMGLSRRKKSQDNFRASQQALTDLRMPRLRPVVSRHGVPLSISEDDAGEKGPKATVLTRFVSKLDGGAAENSLLGKVAMVLAEDTHATHGQLVFLSTWLNAVLPRALKDSVDAGCLRTSFDMLNFEISIEGTPETMMSAVEEFLETIEIPIDDEDKRRDLILGQLVEVLHPESVRLWCNLKHIGGEKPSADAGFTVMTNVHWQFADVLMPPVADQNILRDYALQENYSPSGWGTSLFPTNPESSLFFDMVGGTSDTTIMAGLFFFKALGFIKPDDDVMKVFHTAQAKGCRVCVAMGPEGLTRVNMSMLKPRVGVIPDIAKVLGQEHKAKLMELTRLSLGAEVGHVDFAVEGTNGFVSAVGFQC